jgi:hypothetical protein
MKPDIVSFFALQRRIFGLCPSRHNFFRLSDCKICLKRNPAPDWLDNIERESLNE